MKNGEATPLPVCRSEANEMLTLRSNGGICEQVYVGSLGERAIVPVALASGDDFYYSIWSNPTLTRVYSTAEEEKAHTEENPTCSRINPKHSKYGEWKVQSTKGKYNSTLCKGIIDEYFVPSGLVHPLQPPGLAEDILEGKARNISLEGLLDPVSPLIMPTECQSEWKKFACGAAFMPAALTPIWGEWGQIGMDYSWVFAGTSNYANGTAGRDNRIMAWINMPRFLHQDQCQTLMTKCKRFIDYVQEKRKEEGEEPVDICGAKIKGVGASFDGKDQFPNVTMFPLLALGGPSVPNCKRVDILSGGLQVELMLKVFTETRILDYPPFDTVVRTLACPYPLKEVGPGTKHPNDERMGVLFTGCAIGCPQPFWPFYYHTVIKWYLIVVAWICFVTITYTVVTFLYFKRLRKQRQTLIFSGCTWMLCFSQCMMSLASKDFHHICTQDNLDTIEQYDGLTVCLAQSVILMYFATGCTYWWFLVAVDLFMKVHNKMKYAFKFKTQVVIAQGLPALWCIYFSFWSGFGNQGLHLCWVNKLGVLPPSLSEYGTKILLDGREVYTVLNVDKPWYFLIMINLIFGLCLMVGTMYKIAVVDNKAASKKNGTSSSKKEKSEKKMGARQKKTIKVYMKKWRLYKTSVYFVCLYVGLFITICCYRFIEASDDNQEAVRASARIWAKCLFSNFPHPGYNAIEEGDCADGPTHKPAIVFMAATMTFVICLGFGMYAIYGSKTEYMKLWKNELAAKGFMGAQSSVRNASNVNGTICSSRAGDEDGKKKKKKKGFFANNSVMSSGRVSGASSAMSSGSRSNSSTASSSSGSTVEDSKPDPSDYIPPRHILNTLKKKEKDIVKFDKTCGVYAQTEAVEEVREDKTSFTVHIGATTEWAENIHEFLEATDGAMDDLRNTLYIMTKACSFPELQGWVCAKYTYDPLKGTYFPLSSFLRTDISSFCLLNSMCEFYSCIQFCPELLPCRRSVLESHHRSTRSNPSVARNQVSLAFRRLFVD